MFITSVATIIAIIFFWSMGKMLTVIKNSKALNFYTHTWTWLIALVLCAESIYTFIASGTIASTSI